METDKHIDFADVKIEKLENQIDELSSDLAENFYHMIKILGNIVAQTERYYESSHSRFVSEKSFEVATELGMDEADAFEVKIAGLLHDIGKIGFKDILFMKYPNEMTPLESRQYSNHPELGMRILSVYKGFDTICKIIYQHHERLDGSGFPNRLRAENIHPAARIIAVVDVYHNALFRRDRDRTSTTRSAMKYVSSASYLDATKSKFAGIMNYIHQKKGILFEKRVVDVFTELMEIERMKIGKKTVMRLPINKLEPGMVFAEDYFTNYGMLIASRGEIISKETPKSLLRFAESGEIPHKILIMK